ncbi:MAG: FlgD immunoglobulin-like domain containing protein [bacterium]|nr:FlgD immunoglobulin-like domain containing protein [bacterium]MDD5353730.1 FlgD immunoglobulin-like domain containing protein [bacterium]MDD5755892.1 FlgD immunoglobulin-like domain containing protein [bacterium]
MTFKKTSLLLTAVLIVLGTGHWAAGAQGDFFNVPNPFNSSREKTAIRFFVDDAQEVKISIYSLIGELVKDWTVYAARGQNSLEWDGRNGDGKKVESGGYICVIEKSSGKSKCKIAVIK